MSTARKFNLPAAQSSVKHNLEPIFFEKYALKYYAFLLNMSITIIILETTHHAGLAAIYQIFINMIGYYLWTDKQDVKPFSKHYNSSIWHQLPLIVNCISVAIYLMFVWNRYDLICTNSSRFLALVICSSIAIGTNIDYCHELIHRDRMLFKFIGFITLTLHLFTTYPIQHIYVHHKYVGSPLDPITAAKNYSFYKYFPRAIWSSYKATFNYSKLFFLLCMFLNGSYIGLLCLTAHKQGYSLEQGTKKVLFMLSIVLLNLTFMEGIQYIEHYGLVYRNDPERQPINQKCSWNTYHNMILNMLVARFQRHTDHHMNAYKIYSSLELNDKMAIYPFDFLTAIFIAFVPPLWYKVSNPLVDQVLENKTVSKQHLKYIQSVVRMTEFIGVSLVAILLYSTF